MNTLYLLPKNAQSLIERERRIVARGETSGHSHVIIGGTYDDEHDTLVVSDDHPALIRHLIESEWLGGRQVWTGEHADIYLHNGNVKVVHQEVYDPVAAQQRYAAD